MPPIRLVILIVGAVLLLSVGGIIGLALEGKPIPDVLQNVAVGALAGLIGLLARPKDEDESASP